MKALRRLVVGLAAVAGAGFVFLAATSSYYGGSRGQGCARCHEIGPMVDTWAASTHRAVPCSGCHGRSLSADLRMHLKNTQRVWLHASGRTPEQIHVRHQDVPALVDRCRSCHAQEYSGWKRGPHGVTYARIFLDPTHNRNQQLMDDCLRCHGMHYEGGITRLVGPVDRQGPWRLTDARLADEPAIPCPACHQVHREGKPLGPHVTPSPRPSTGEEINRPSLALYDRRSLDHVPVADLPLPTLHDGDRPVHASPDQRQALCYQCHAPRVEAQVFSGDDRTPTGVHEGLSCLACHQGHGQSTRASCSGCHPRLSNCGRDVETMDTTFHSPESRHNIHSVACVDCHPRGLPASAKARRPRRLAP